MKFINYVFPNDNSALDNTLVLIGAVMLMGMIATVLYRTFTTV